MINRNDGASQYDIHIDKALSNQSSEFIYIVKDIKDFQLFPRILALIFFWIRAQYILFFKRVDIAIVSPWMMLIYPRYISIISIAHHYDPSVFKGIRKIYIKLSHWLFILQRSKVDVVVSCSKYWSHYYKSKGFKKTNTIFNGFDIDTMDQCLNNRNINSILKQHNLSTKNYIHLGSYGLAKGQKTVLKCLKDYKLPMLVTSPNINLFDDSFKEIKLINATYEEYNILLKNAKAVICMSEFEEGWCRVLHEAAIHGTIILGSGKGGMKELLEIGGLKPSTIDTLADDFNERIKEICLSKDKVELYRSYTLEKFYEAWRYCLEELLEYKEKI